MGITVSRRAAQARIQRRLNQREEHLVKVRETSRYFDEYGPYNSTGCVTSSGWLPSWAC